MRKNFFRTSMSTLGMTLFLMGCATNTAYVDPGSTRVIASVGKINIQDFTSAADEMTQSLVDHVINTGKLKTSVPGQPSLVAISRFVNGTGQQIDTDLLIKKVRIGLNRTDRIQISGIIGVGSPEDPLAVDRANADHFLSDGKSQRLPDYTLSGKILEQRDRAGEVRQSAFVFQMSLVGSSGIAIWEEEKTIVKQGKRPTVGF